MRILARVVVALAVAAAHAGPLLAQTQEQPPPPPNLLVIFREEVRPGKGGAHEASELSWGAAYRKADAPIQWLGMTSLSGPTEAWFISGYDSYASFQKVNDAFEASPALRAEGQKFAAQESDILSRTSTIIASLRPDMGYGQPVSIPQMRYMQVDLVQIRPGYGVQFGEMLRESRAAHEKAQMKEEWAVYSVDSGMPAGTYLFLYPRRTLAALDEVGKMHTAASYRDAVGESGRARYNQFVREAVVSQETLLFGFRPGMSLMPKEFMAADPDYWTPKGPATPRKPGEKP